MHAYMLGNCGAECLLGMYVGSIRHGYGITDASFSQAASDIEDAPSSPWRHRYNVVRVLAGDFRARDSWFHPLLFPELDIVLRCALFERPEP